MPWLYVGGSKTPLAQNFSMFGMTASGSGFAPIVDDRRSGGLLRLGGAVVGDARRPDGGLALGEVAVGRQPRIRVAPALDVDEILRARQDRAAAHTLARVGRRELALQPCRQL